MSVSLLRLFSLSRVSCNDSLAVSLELRRELGWPSPLSRDKRKSKVPLLKGGQEVGPWSFLQEKEVARNAGHRVQQLLGFSWIFVQKS